MIAAFFDWWGSELGALVPRALRRLLGIDRDSLLVRPTAAGPVTDLDRGGQRAPIAPSAARELGARAETVLTLDPGVAIRRTLRLPRAAAAQIDGVLAFEIERHTPFRADEVHAVHSIDEAASDPHEMAVRLVVVPRRAVDGALAAARAEGFLPERVAVARDENGAALVTLPVSGLAAAENGRRPLILSALAALLLLAIVSPLLRLEWAAEQTMNRVARARAGAEGTLTLQREADRLGAAATALASLRAQSPAALAVIEELSRLLPDDTWVVQLQLGGGEGVIEGRTGSSAALVGLVERSPLFEDAAYAGPVTRDPAGGERFGIDFRLTGVKQTDEAAR